MHKFFKWNIHTLNIVIILLFTLAFYLPGSLYGILFDRDLIVYSLPLKVFFFDSIKRGDFPFWNPYVYCGYPATGDAAVGYFYPLNILYLIFKYNVALTLYTMIHSFLAGTFLYLFLKKENCPPLGALLGALCFAFSGYLISVVHTQTFLVTSVWLVAYLVIVQYLNSGSFLRVALLSALPLTFQILHGDIFTYGLTVTLGFFYLLLCTETTFKQILKQKIITILFSFGLAALVVIPMIQLTLESQRVLQGISPREAFEFSMNPFRLLDLVVPYFEYYGFSPFFQAMWSKSFYPTKRLAPWAESIYVGIIPVLTFFYCLIQIHKNKLKVNFWIVAAVIGTVLATGKYLKVYNLLYMYFPGMHLLRYPEKFFILTTLSLSILVGYAFQKLLLEKTRLLAYTILPLFYLLALSIILKPQLMELILSLKSYYVKEDYVYAVVTTRLTSSFLFAFALLLISIMHYKKILTLKVTAMIVVALCMFDVLFINRQVLYYAPESLLFSRPALLKYMDKHAEDPYYRIRTFLPGEAKSSYPPKNFRYNVKNAGKELLYDNMVAAYRTFSMNGFSPLALYRYVKFFEGSNNFTGFVKSFSISSINFVIYNEEHKSLENIGLKRLLTIEMYGNHFVVFKNKFALPRTYVAYNTIYEPDSDKAAEITHRPKFRYRLNIVTSKKLNYPQRKKYLIPATITHYSNNQVNISACTDEAGILVLNDTYYPEWEAYVNGKKVEILLVNGYFRGVEIPKGTSQIVFKYKPSAFYLGLSISLVFMILMAGLFLIKRKPREEQKEQD